MPKQVKISGLPQDTTEAKVRQIFGPYGTVAACKIMVKGVAILGFSDDSEADWIVENLDGNCAEGLMEPIKCAFFTATSTAAAAPAGGGLRPGGMGAAAGGAKPQAWTKPGGGGGGGCGGGGGGNQMAQMMQMMAQMKGGGKGGPYGGGCGGMMGAMGMMGDMASILNATSRTAPGADIKSRGDSQQVQVRGLPGDCTDYDLYRLMAPYGAIPPKGVKAMLNPEGMCTGVGWVDFNDDACAAAACEALNGFNGMTVRTKKPRPVPQAL